MPAKEVAKSKLVEVFPGSSLRLKYKDIFDIEQYYTALHDWFLEYGWDDAEEKGSDHYETYYGERVDRNGNREIWIWWRLQKNAKDGRFKYYLDLNFHFLGINSIEIVKEGRKIKAHKGEVEMTIKPIIEETYKEVFEENPLLSLFKEYIIDIFTKRTYRKDIETRKKELYQETYTLQNFIKQWFKMKRYLPYEEARSFSPSYAWPSHFKE